MKKSSQNETNIQVITSMMELLIILKWTNITINITGTQIAKHEFNKNLDLIKACLHNHLTVSHKLENVKLILLITASQAEPSLSMI